MGVESMNRDIIKVGFAVLAAVTTYNFADMVINAQENDTQPIVDVNVTNNDNVLNTDVVVDKKSDVDSNEQTNSQLNPGWSVDFRQ